MIRICPQRLTILNMKNYLEFSIMENKKNRNKTDTGKLCIGIIILLLALFVLLNSRFRIWLENAFFGLLLPPLTFLIIISIVGILLLVGFNFLKLKYRIKDYYLSLKKRDPEFAKWLLDQVIGWSFLIVMVVILYLYRGH